MRPLQATILFQLMIFIVGCTEIYVPNVESDQEALVVEGLITNGDGPFFVKLTKALPYNSDLTAKAAYVTDAMLTVTDSEGQSFDLAYQTGGTYRLPDTFSAVTGRSYTLHIETSDGETYESDAQKLLMPIKIDTLYSKTVTKNYLNKQGILVQVPGYEVRANLFHVVSSENRMPLCRFESDVVVQYQYSFIEIDRLTMMPMDWNWFVFGWNTFDLDETSNITQERTTSAKAEIKDHYLCFIPKQTDIYGISTFPDASMIYYYRLKQYTINDETYRFYEEANKQLDASGKIFDPITSQLYGNMHCTSNPSKKALGMFEVSSVSMASYLVRRSTVPVPYIATIPVRGESRYKFYPDGRPTNDSEFVAKPYPYWWSHSK